MADEKKIELTVERVGDKLAIQFDPEALAKPGSCCNCNSQALNLDAVGRVATDLPSQRTGG